MASLMVSARNLLDANVAIHSGAAILDLKEPLNGALGMVPFETACSVVREVPPYIPIGYSLGEWVDWQKQGAELPPIPPGLAYLKVGLAGMTRTSLEQGWQSSYQKWRQRAMDASRIGGEPKWVAVMYADWRVSDAPSPNAILEVAREDFGALLVDTYRKDGSPDGLFRWFNSDDLRRLVDQAHALDLEVALAGSLSPAGVERAAGLGADVVGVRTAVCTQGRRHGCLDATAVRHLVGRLSGVIAERPGDRSPGHRRGLRDRAGLNSPAEGVIGAIRKTRLATE